MVETGGFIPPDAEKGINPVMKYELEAGMTAAEIGRQAGVTEDQARAALIWLDQVSCDNPGQVLAGAAREIRTDDEYRLPAVAELINGGGQYWRPLFSAERAGEIRSEDDIRAMAEQGLPHMLTQRDSLVNLLEQLPQGEQTGYKALSARIVEMRVLRNLIEQTLASGNTKLAERLASGMDADALLKQGEQLGLLRPGRLGGRIASDADDIRSSLSGKLPAFGITAAMLKMEAHLGTVLKNPPTPIKTDTFLPHLSPVYVSAFGRYSTAKLSTPSASPVL